MVVLLLTVGRTKMNKITSLIPCALLVVTGCAPIPVMEARPEIILHGVSVSKARSAVAQACDENQAQYLVAQLF